MRTIGGYLGSLCVLLVGVAVVTCLGLPRAFAAGESAATLDSVAAGGLEITATGSKTSRKLKDRFADVLNVRDFGAVGDGVTDDTQALKAALDAVPAAGATVVLKAGDTYLLDASMPLLLKPRTRIVGYGATLRVKPGHYPRHGAVLTTDTRLVGWFDPSFRPVKDVEIVGVAIDGNLANVAAPHSITAIHLYRVDNALVRDVRAYDLPGTTGEGYGIFVPYSARVRIENCSIRRTDRQNINIWETTDATVKDCTLRDSFTRDVLIAGSNEPPLFQETRALISGGEFSNSMGDGIPNDGPTHVVRFGGVVTAVLEDVDIRGSPTLDGVYIIGGSSKTIRIHHARISGVKYAVRIETDGPGLQKLYDISDNEFVGCLNGLRANSVGGTLLFSRNHLVGTIVQPIYVAHTDTATVDGNIIDGGSTRVYLKADASGPYLVTNNTILHLTDADYALAVGGSPTNAVNVTGNVLTANTAQAISHQSIGVVAYNVGATVSSGTAWILTTRAQTSSRVVLRSASVVAIDASAGNEFVLTATNPSPLTFANPANAREGQRITVRVRNDFGALGEITMGNAFKFTGAPKFPVAANGYSRAIDFQYDGKDWIEVSRTPGDVPN